jgi:ribonuclease T1
LALGGTFSRRVILLEFNRFQLGCRVLNVMVFARKSLVAGWAALALGSVGVTSAWAKPSAPYCEARGNQGCDVVLSALPSEAQKMQALIRDGGPFRYDKDGVVFSNRERLLPREKRGYYREYTVRTPGSRDRGARRIVCGGTQPQAPEACYYTDDHYASFRRIVTAP